MIVSLTFAAAVAAQAPVEDLAPRDAAIQRSQLEAGRAYRALQQAQYEAKLAEQDHLNTDAAHRAARERAEELRRQAEAAKKALDAAKARVAKARAEYEAALRGVDQAWSKPAPK